jgi:hypothetical protein
LRFNDLVVALDRPVPRSILVRRASKARGRLRLLLPIFRSRLVAAHPVGRVLTDDRAPVEWLTDRMLLEQIARGQGLDEGALPTEP